ncbi:MAG: hypothetical protein IPJ98_22625 [Bryobacterales bacterium]|nr:hypothetical protein [Bryobacterales bacterium]
MPSRVPCAALVCLIAPVWPAQPQTAALSIQPVIVKAEYCRQKDGRFVLRLQTRTELTNEGPDPLLVPKITRLAAKRLTPEHGRAYRSEYELTKYDESPPSLYTSAAPSPEYFATLRPGEAIHHGGNTLIFSLAPRSHEPATRRVPSGPYSLRLTLNFGPYVRPKPGDAPAAAKERWRDHGALVLGPVESRPAPVIVEAPRDTLCVGPPLIMKR